MDVLDRQLLDIIKARGEWNRTVHMRLPELCDLVENRFSVPRPTPQTVRASIHRLIRWDKVRWGHVTNSDVWILA